MCLRTSAEVARSVDFHPASSLRDLRPVLERRLGVPASPVNLDLAGPRRAIITWVIPQELLRCWWQRNRLGGRHRALWSAGGGAEVGDLVGRARQWLRRAAQPGNGYGKMRGSVRSRSPPRCGWRASLCERPGNERTAAAFVRIELKDPSIRAVSRRSRDRADRIRTRKQESR
jgi:hypothetical protein